MPLEGNLLDFDLPDIFQLIAKQRKSGVLNISSGENRGAIMFLKGDIVFAQKNSENLQTMLTNFLTLIKRYSRDEVQELAAQNKNNIQNFLRELVSRNYCSAEDLEELWRIGIEDLACSLFLWEEGAFRFEAQENTSLYGMHGITFSTDAITMEAMRRIDEWKVMREFFDEQAVFMLSDANTLQSVAQQNAQCAHILYLLNGRRTIAEIARRSFLAIYRIHEYLFGLWKNNTIVQIQAQAAPAGTDLRSPAKAAPALLSQMALSIAAALCVLCASFLLGTVLLRNTLLQNFPRTVQNAPNTEITSGAIDKIRIAALAYQAQTGDSRPTLAALAKADLISRHDIDLYKRFAAPQAKTAR